MKKFINASLEEQALVFQNVSDKRKINTAIVEKDFWVTFILDYLFNEFKFKNSLCFKGGTSLSKVYNYIERFSEDIDIALDWGVLGFAENEPYEARSKTAQNRFNEVMNLETIKFIKEKWLPMMHQDLQKMINYNFSLEIDQVDNQTINFRYPQQFEDNSILQVIRIEIGALAERIPEESNAINSFIGETYPKLFEKNDVSIKSLSPIRTLYEKLLILHREANRRTNETPIRYARHYYDVYQIIRKGNIEQIFNNIEILYKVIEFNKKFYPYNWANYDEIYKGSLNLIPSNETLKILKKDYESMKEMIFGNIPEFDDILKELEIFEETLNRKIIKDLRL